MKIAHFILALALVALTGCATTAPVYGHRRTAWDIPETVVITYHVQPSCEATFPGLLARAWGIYRRGNLVRTEPHVIVRSREEDGKLRFVETFTWVSHSAPDHAPAEVQAVWNQEMSACEGRNGHRAIEGGEVELVAP